MESFFVVLILVILGMPQPVTMGDTYENPNGHKTEAECRARIEEMKPDLPRFMLSIGVPEGYWTIAEERCVKGPVPGQPA